MTALIYAPFPDRDSARAAAGALLEEKLIACANILGDLEAVFVWQGEVQSAQEVGVLFKTDGSLLERATARLGSLHPYDTPAILGWHCDAAAAQTRDWLSELSAGVKQ